MSIELKIAILLVIVFSIFLLEVFYSSNKIKEELEHKIENEILDKN